MKKFSFFTTAILFFAITSFAKTITVSNNPNSPGQYKDLQTAIDSANAGDILLVSGSGITYGSVTVNKQLTIYGQGYDPRKDIAFPTTIDYIYLDNSLVNNSANGTVIAGCFISQVVTPNNGPSQRVSNIVLKRNNISTVGIRGDNWLITDNIIAGYIDAQNSSGILIKNNIITGNEIQNDQTSTNLIITNNDFAANVYLVIYNAIVSNNIFYNKTASVSNFVYGASTYNTVFNNNIYYNNSNANPFNIGQQNNTGTGNKNNVNPKYVSYDLTTASITRTDNLQLQASSPGKNAGTDGKDIGAYGGAVPMQYPLSGEPAIPQVKTMNINNTTVAPGAILQVQVKANSNN